MYSLRHAARRERDSADSSTPPILRLPDVGRSMPAIRLSSVVLPLPDGPISARNVPASTSRSRLSSGVIVAEPLRYDRVSWRHSMSGMVGPLPVAGRVARRRRGVIGFADSADALARLQRRRVARDELVAGMQAFGDGDPPLEARVADRHSAHGRLILAALDDPDGRLAGAIRRQ